MDVLSQTCFLRPFTKHPQQGPHLNIFSKRKEEQFLLHIANAAGEANKVQSWTWKFLNYLLSRTLAITHHPGTENNNILENRGETEM